ncbi:Hypothetical protein HDN1F_30130 [gamma proteobacterium HdN1]|nr:Hypothetical protein HDN1F_30130 [gamma proteobacterium HdN1]
MRHMVMTRSATRAIMSPLKRTISTALSAALLASVGFQLGGCAPQWLIQGTTSSYQSSAPAPDFTLKNDAGHNQRLAEYAGEVRMLVFTGSPCYDCTQLVRKLESATAGMSDYGFQFWNIHVGKPPPVPARKIVSSRNRALLWDTNERTARSYGVSALPAVFLVDRDGVIRETLGADAAEKTASIAEKLQQIAEE